MLQTIESVNTVINNFIWGIPAMICIIGVGLWLSCRTKFIQFTRVGRSMKTVLGSLFQKKGGYVVLGGKFRLKDGEQSAIAAKSRELNEKRRDKQPLDLPSAGSAFKRPVGGFAAALIEQAGLKGFSIGGAQVSEKHAGFVVNRGGATADDVRALMAHVKKTVLEKTGIDLEP